MNSCSSSQVLCSRCIPVETLDLRPVVPNWTVLVAHRTEPNRLQRSKWHPYRREYVPRGAADGLVEPFEHV